MVTNLHESLNRRVMQPRFSCGISLYITLNVVKDVLSGNPFLFLSKKGPKERYLKANRDKREWRRERNREGRREREYTKKEAPMCE